MTLRIAIVGAGSAGMVCASTVFGYCRERNLSVTFTSIYDPNISPIRVGESMSPMLLGNLNKFLHIFDFNSSCQNFEDLDMITRVGAKHRWEDDVNRGYTINYPTFAAHFDSAKFIQFSKNKLKLLSPYYNEIHDTVTDIRQSPMEAIVSGTKGTYLFDYVFDCRGFPTQADFDSGDYLFPEFETVNSLIVFQEKKQYVHPYTDNIIHRNGWQFGINTTNRKAHGYLYNKDITPKEEALEHFIELNKNVDVDREAVNSFSWKFYYAKRAIDNRIIKMGNKLFFYEPIQGIPLHHYSIFTLMCMDYISCSHYGSMMTDFNDYISQYLELDLSKNTPEEVFNIYHSHIMEVYFEIICSNYIGNQMNSDFWNITKSKAMSVLRRSPTFMNFARNVVEYQKGNQQEYPSFYIHPGFIIKQYMEGLQVNFHKIIEGEA